MRLNDGASVVALESLESGCAQNVPTVKNGEVNIHIDRISQRVAKSGIRGL